MRDSPNARAWQTESVKLMLQYLAAAATSHSVAQRSGSVADRVLSSNPLLEALGNACTLRNDNSSRFGKFLEVQIDSFGGMSGARIHVYLLEKSRVTAVAEGERSFHVFYQLLAGLDAQERSELRLPAGAGAGSFRLLSGSSRRTVAGVDDAEQMRRTLSVMVTVGLTPSEVCGAKRVLAASLLLGQLAFARGDDDATVVTAESAEWAESAARLLSSDGGGDSGSGGLEGAALCACLCSRTIEAGGETVVAKLDVRAAAANCEALIKAMYAALFGWLVRRANLSVASDQTSAFIGVLDIFGFESFEHNSFEQVPYEG